MTSIYFIRYFPVAQAHRYSNEQLVNMETVKSISRQEEVDANYEAFKAMLPELKLTHPNKFALMHSQKVIACFDTSRDAIVAGHKLIDGLFSVQQVTDRPVDLGYFSHVGVHWAV